MKLGATQSPAEDTSVLTQHRTTTAWFFERIAVTVSDLVKLSKPAGHVMHQQFNIQQLYVLPTLYLCVLYLSENKQRLVSLTA